MAGVDVRDWRTRERPAGPRRLSRINIRLTPDELAQIAAAAHRHGLDPTAWARQLLLEASKPKKA